MLEVVQVGSVDELFALLRSDTRWGDGLRQRWIFRGQADKRWRLKPGAWRDDFIKRYSNIINEYENRFRHIRAVHPKDSWRGLNWENEIKYYAHTCLEKTLIQEFYYYMDIAGVGRSLARDRFGELLKSQSDVKDFDYGWELEMVACQHAGLPTRLLDWTFNSLKALYFSIDVGKKEQSSLAIYALDASILFDKNHINEQIGLIQPLRFEHSYVRNQEGIFTVLRKIDHYYLQKGRFPDIESMINTDVNAIPLTMYKFEYNLGDGDKEKIVKMLLRAQISRPHLMPIPESCATQAQSNIILFGSDPDISGL
ncbi:FRG domain-containing protein [Xanthobacter autotrophicus]|uniref:FRG domain-containing protein n=1 Tax=Xanthobacter autotrophicus TaxID=280 RepID=UPI00372A8EC4